MSCRATMCFVVLCLGLNNIQLLVALVPAECFLLYRSNVLTGQRCIWCRAHGNADTWLSEFGLCVVVDVQLGPVWHMGVQRLCLVRAPAFACVCSTVPAF